MADGTKIVTERREPSFQPHNLKVWGREVKTWGSERLDVIGG